MIKFLSVCSIFSTVAIVHALPPIEARTSSIPEPGESCVYHWPGHSRLYSGTVTKTDDCKGGVSFWQYGADAPVQCCVREPCTGFSDSDGGEYAQYSCLNTYKTDECNGKFSAGHCLGDSTVQCCLGSVAQTSFNNPGAYPNEVQTSEGTVVPTVDETGTSSSSSQKSDADGVVVPTYPTSSRITNDEEQASGADAKDLSKDPTYGYQSDGSYVVKTIPTPKDELSWRIIPKLST